MLEHLKTNLTRLVDIPAPPGFEDKVREAVRGQIQELVDEVAVDRLGNLIATMDGSGANPPLIMLSAHLAEVGLIATHVDPRGFVRFAGLGDLQPRYLLGGRAQFLDGTRGTISAEGELDSADLPPIKKMYIDLGEEGREDHPVSVGDPGVFEGPPRDLGKRLISKALDNRAGVAVLIEVIRQLSAEPPGPHRLAFVFSVREEVSRKGVGPAAFRLQPDVGLGIDVTPTGDTPGISGREVQLGGGPAVKIRDQNLIVDSRVLEWITSSAEAGDIPYQRDIQEEGTSDAAVIQVSRSGVPSGGVSIPCRYGHGPSEMVDWRDLEDAVKLLVELTTRPLDWLRE